jgi:hypothetical protein
MLYYSMNIIPINLKLKTTIDIYFILDIFRERHDPLSIGRMALPLNLGLAKFYQFPYKFA